MIPVVSVLTGCTEEKDHGGNNVDYNNNTTNHGNNSPLDPSEVKEHLIATWMALAPKYSQVGFWMFYENDTMKTVWRGVFPGGELGSENVVWWRYFINGTKLCFSSPSDPLLNSACYDYEFLENFTHLRVTYQGLTMDWYKMNKIDKG